MLNFEFSYAEGIGLLIAIFLWTVMLVTLKKGILSRRYFIRLCILFIFIVIFILFFLFANSQSTLFTFASVVIPVIWGFVDSLIPDIIRSRNRVVLILKANTSYSISLAASIQAEVKSRLLTVEIESYFCTRGENINDQEAILRREMVKKPDTIIIVPPPHNIQLARCAVEAIKDGIPIITIDDVLDQNIFIANKIFPPLHIATSFDVGGRIAAKAMIRALNGKGHIVIISGPPESSPSQSRKLAFIDEIVSSSQGVSVVASRNTIWNMHEAEEHVHELLALGITIDGVFCCNDTLAIGVLHAFKSIEAKNSNVNMPIIIGFDGTKDIEPFILNKEIYASINAGIEFQGQLAVDQLIVILKDKKKHLNELHTFLHTNPRLLSREVLLSHKP